MNILFLSIGELSNLDENSMYPDLLRYFREKGHRVSIICPRERRYGLPTEKRKEQGIEILRVKTGNITKTNLLEKGITTLMIGMQFKRAINKFYQGIKFDLILYSTPPITLVNTVQYLKERDNAFTYLLLKDIFPQNALDLGILKKNGWKGIITRYFLTKEKKLYLQSEVIGCMSEANIKFLKANHSYLYNKRIEVCPNTINSSPNLLIDRISLIDKFKLPKDKLIFVCGGNFGKPQDVDFILDVIKKNEGTRDRHFVMCGSGTDFYKIKKYSQNRNANHITVIDSLKKEEFHQLLDVSDVGLLFLDHRFTIPNFPSRLLDYMNHSMPVLAATDRCTDIGKTITSNGFGWWCESKDVNAYSRILDEICKNPMVIDEMRKNSKLVLINNYDTRIAYEKIIKAYQLRRCSTNHG